MWRPLGDVARVSTAFPFRSRVMSEEGGDIALVQLKDLNVTEGVAEAGRVRLRSDRGAYGKYLLEPGDVLFQSRGWRHPAGLVPEKIRGIAASGLHVLRPDSSRLLPGYLVWWLNHPSAQSQLTASLARGTHVPFVSKGDLELFRIPVPALVVQARIAEVERLRRAEQQLTMHLTELKEKLIAALTLKAAQGNKQRKKAND